MTLGRGAGLDESGRRRRVDRSPPVSEEDQLKAHLGDDLGETVFERACIIHADRVPWDRALAQAEALHRP